MQNMLCNFSLSILLQTNKHYFNLAFLKSHFFPMQDMWKKVKVDTAPVRSRFVLSVLQ